MAPSTAVWPTSDCLAAGCGELVKVWQPGDPTSEIKIFEGTSVYCVDFSRNNKVLAVAGDKGQVVVYSNRPHPPSGDRSVGRFPDLPKAGLDCITCVRFAPSDTHLIGGARTGTVHIWSLRSKEGERVITGLNGSATSVAINHTTEMLASASSTGQVLLHDFKTGQKWKSLLRGGGQAAGNLSFSRLSPGQLAGGNSSGQLLAWDLDRMELADELEVHKGAVTGLSFSEASAELLLSCSADGTVNCTDRRMSKAVWSVGAPRGCFFSSLSAKHDGRLLAVGTSAGAVQVHDVRRASQVLSVQQFSDTSSPVTTVRWQHLHASRGSLRAASASVAPSSTVTPSVSAALPASAAVSSATTTTWQRQQHASAAPGHRAAAAAGSTAAAAGGAAKSPGLLSEVSNTSVSVDFGIRALSPVQMLGSPADEAESAPPLQPQPAAAAAPSTSTLRTPAAPASAAPAATVTPSALGTPADSLASAGPGAAPFMFTPGIGLGYANGADTPPPAGAELTPISMPAGAGPGSINASSAAVAQVNAAAAAAVPEPAAAAAEGAGRLGSRRNSSSNGLDNRQPAAGPGRTGSRGALLSGAAAGAGSNVGGASASAAGGGAASGKGSGPSRSNSGVSLATAAAAAGGASRPGSRPSSGGSAAAGTAVAGGSRRSTRSSADGSAEAGLAAAPPAAAGAAASRPGSAASAGGEGAGAAEAGGKGSEGLLLAASRPGSAAAVAVGGLREDVFKAYVDQQMKELRQDVKAMHLDMLRQFHQAQMDLVSVVDGVVQRQDQLAEMVAELATAVQGLRSTKQQPGSLMPWI